MNGPRFLLGTLVYHWRGNTALALGVAVGSAVLTGALLVGDSLQGSLRDQALEQLGCVWEVMAPGRFFREDLAERVGKSQDIACRLPAIFLQGAVTLEVNNSGQASSSLSPISGRRGQGEGGQTAPARANRVQVWGVESSYWPWQRGVNVRWLLDPASADPALSTADRPNATWDSAEPELVINQALADELGARRGFTVSVHVTKASAVPRETLLGRRDPSAVLDTIQLKVAAVIPNVGPGRFQLAPSPEVPRIAYVPLHFLQKQIDQPGLANVILFGPPPPGRAAEIPPRYLTLEDWGLVLRDPVSRAIQLFERLDRNHDRKLSRGEWLHRMAESVVRDVDQNHDGALTFDEVKNYYQAQHGYLSLESRQMLIEPVVEEAASKAATEAELTAAPTLVYLANSISDGTHSIPYSIVAALDPSLSAPLGPFLPAGVKHLEENEIVLAGWKDSPIKAKPGALISLTYFQPEIEGQPREVTASFRLKGYVPLEGVAADPDLTPEFPGITDKLTIRDWDPPFPYDNKRVKKVDEQFWEQYRTTPKAYVTLETGQRLWGSRFGKLTSIRLAAVDAKQTGQDAGRSLGDIRAKFREALLAHLDPARGGFVLDNVHDRALAASTGGTDFRGLFLGFSFFLIASALLLVALLFRLNLDRRGSEVGLLFALGFSRRRVRWLLLAEGILTAAVGALAGLALGVGYAWLLLDLLRRWWPGGLDQSFLQLHLWESGGWTFVIGYFGSVGVSVLTIVWAVRMLGKSTPRGLIAGETMERAPAVSAGRARWSRWIAVASAILGVCILPAGLVAHDAESQASAFFGGGALLLTAGLAASWVWMRPTGPKTHDPSWQTGIGRLGIRNAKRYPVRSLLTVGLLAAAVFLIIAVESFHRDVGRDYLARDSGTGGFALLAETNVPIFQDLNTPKGRDELNFSDDGAGAWRDVSFFACRSKSGDDASCLNLFAPRRPRLLGVPRSFVERDGFRFQEALAGTPEEKKNPWLLLERSQDGAIPAIADATTAEWMLKVRPGGTVEIPDERGQPVKLCLVGLLSESIFQSQLLISEENFRRLYPHHEGYQFLLVDTPAEKTAEVQRLLQGALANHGFEVTSTRRRLETYLAVENTYLATFQALGGLGLLLGALGLAVVLLRAIWERRSELALLRALGFRRSALGWLVFSENAFLLVWGLAIGTVTAVLAVAPRLLTAGGTIPWGRLAGLVGLVLVVGLAAGAWAVVTSLRAPLLPALKRE